MAGFAEELAAANRGAVSLPKGNAESTTETPEQHFAMPENGSIHPEQMNDSVDISETTPQAPMREGRIVIGDQVFDSTEEAMAYANSLHLTQVEQSAFEKGKKSVSQSETVVAEPDWTEEVEKEIFENPKAAIKKIYEKAVADAEKLVDKKDEEKTRAAKAEEARQATWNGFYEENNDLSTPQARDVVNGILQRDWAELGPMQSKEALPLLAKKARAFIASLKETQLPTTVLQANKVVTTKSGTPSTNVATEKKASTLDFISQVNNHRKRGAKINN